MRIFLLLFFFTLSIVTRGQDNVFQSGVLPEITMSYGLTENVKLTGKVESMSGVYNNVSPETSDWDYQYLRTDLQSFVLVKLNPFWSVAGGYQYRIGNNGHSHRTIQQLAFVQRLAAFRLGHRLRTDQTFATEEDVRFRIRYRASVELPMQGQAIDKGECYLIFSCESIYETQSNSQDLENRLAGAIGYYMNRNHKFETGIDYRMDRIIENPLRQRLWIKLAWFVNL